MAHIVFIFGATKLIGHMFIVTTVRKVLNTGLKKLENNMDIMRYGGSPFGHIKFSATAKKVHFDDERMYVTLMDEREISVPLKWFPILQHATPEQRNQWKLVHDGIGLRWEEIDEGISVKGLLGPSH